jgi:N-acetylneuraminic acid mutarotase
MARWRLPNALSRAGAAPLPDGRVLLLAGLLGSGTSSADVGVLDTANGKLTSIATLPSPTHDAGSAELGGRAFLFGGGQSAPFALVQEVTIPRSLGPGTSEPATVIGQLPQLRADDEAVTVGRAAYVVGGYDGSTGDAAVLMTTNGSTFASVVTLPVAVRYPAVTSAHSIIYVFGGEAEQGGTTNEFSTPAGSTTPPPGQQVAVVQEINTRTHAAKVVGSLPHGLQGAAAFDLGGHIYLAGGDSYPPGSTPASGSTIWSFDPSTVSFRVAGRLAAPVSYAAVAVERGAVWLIGGERNGVPVASAQEVRLRTRG